MNVAARQFLRPKPYLRVFPIVSRRNIKSIPSCPEPTCSCQPTPPKLDIDRTGPMTFSPYHSHIVVCTGQSDWASKIELDTTCTPVTRQLKTLLGPPRKRGAGGKGDGLEAGKYHDVSLNPQPACHHLRSSREILVESEMCGDELG